MDHSITIQEFNSICRICLVSKSNMITPISPLIVFMLESCTSVQEESHPNLPQQICNDCYEQLKSAFHFKQQYIISVQILSEIVRKTENDVKDKEVPNVDTETVKVEEKKDIDVETDNKFDISNENKTTESKIKEEELENVDTAHSVDETSNAEPGRESDSESEVECNEEDSENNFATEEKFQKILVKIREMEGPDFICEICGKKFIKKRYLRKHVIVHSDNRPHKCDICSFKTKVAYTLTKHKKIKHGIVKEVRKKSDRGKGNENDSDSNSSTDEIFRKIEKRIRRQKNKRKEGGEYICDICGKKFSQKIYLRNHKIIHSDDRPYECDMCSYTCKRPYDLGLHKRLKHGNNEPKLCYICGKFLRVSLRCHLQSHQQSKENKTLKCEKCNRVYNSEYGLRIHIRLKHTENGIEKTFPCKICNRMFMRPEYVKEHIKLKHLNLKKEHVCNFCNKKYNTKSHLTIHINSAHMNKRPHSCSECGSSFFTKRILESHMRRHTGERPFACTICERTFGFSSALYTHMKRVHPT